MNNLSFAKIIASILSEKEPCIPVFIENNHIYNALTLSELSHNSLLEPVSNDGVFIAFEINDVENKTFFSLKEIDDDMEFQLSVQKLKQWFLLKEIPPSSSDQTIK